ncbi:hypothetical protein Anapl_18937, partial [Anas platyrhynchos]
WPSGPLQSDLLGTGFPCSGNLLSPSGPDSSAPSLCTPPTVPPVLPSSSVGSAWQLSYSAPSFSVSYLFSSLLSPLLTLPSQQADHRVWTAQRHSWH